LEKKHPIMAVVRGIAIVPIGTSSHAKLGASYMTISLNRFVRSMPNSRRPVGSEHDLVMAGVLVPTDEEPIVLRTEP
jgi:hypothetical protein